jgi:hypothetical protein
MLVCLALCPWQMAQCFQQGWGPVRTAWVGICWVGIRNGLEICLIALGVLEAGLTEAVIMHASGVGREKEHICRSSLLGPVCLISSPSWLTP